MQVKLSNQNAEGMNINDPAIQYDGKLSEYDLILRDDRNENIRPSRQTSFLISEPDRFSISIPTMR